MWLLDSGAEKRSYATVYDYLLHELQEEVILKLSFNIYERKYRNAMSERMKMSFIILSFIPQSVLTADP